MKSVSSKQLAYLIQQKKRRQLIVIAQVLILILFIGLWEYASRRELINSFIFCSPSKIVLCFMELVKDRSIFLHTGITLGETIVSFLLVTILSTIIAIILWFFSGISETIEPYLVVLNSLPKSALAPLLIVWLGATKLTIVVAGISVAIFGSILNLYTCFQQVDPDEIKLIYTLGGRKIHALTKVVLPSSAPSIISMMKVNIGLCLVGVIIGEFLAARHGLGYLIIYSSQVFKMDWLLMSLVLLCMMAIGLYAVIGVIEKHFQR